MPIENLIKLAITIMVGIMITHPLTYTTEIRKIEFSILREIGDTRSWGNPSIFPENKSHIHATGRLKPIHNGKELQP
jgi:hypothetical protein